MTKRKKKKHVSYFKIISAGLLIAGVIIVFLLYLDTKTDYHLVIIDKNGVASEIQTYDSFKLAKSNMRKLDHQENENVEITTDDGTRVAIRYGVLNFKTKQCTVNTAYTFDDRDEEGYINGCYGADAVYLDTSNDGKKFKFMMSGVVGWVDRKDVELLDYYNEKEVASVSHYVVKDNTFLHKGTTDVKSGNYAFSLDVGLPFQDTSYAYYYSYDGHYFYPSFTSMSDDYQNNTRKNSVNYDQPYYNYYQFLSHRSISNYSTQDINKYITSILGYTSQPSSYPMGNEESLLFNMGKAFVDAQNRYSTNAIMMMGLSANESAYGRSELAYAKNNLFGHAAYDASPSQSANKYANPQESILVHASVFLNQGYLNACDGFKGSGTCDSEQANRYRGAYLGDKESGMNVRYASDPYWGEKAASFYRKFDKAMGMKDAKFDILIKDVDHAPVYQKADKNSTILYRTPTVKNYSMLVLDIIKNDQGTWYKIKSDAPINKEGNQVETESSAYNVKKSIVFINADDLK